MDAHIDTAINIDMDMDLTQTWTWTWTSIWTRTWTWTWAWTRTRMPGIDMNFGGGPGYFTTKTEHLNHKKKKFDSGGNEEIRVLSSLQNKKHVVLVRKISKTKLHKDL
jgi:hypothetical protein